MTLQVLAELKEYSMVLSTKASLEGEVGQVDQVLSEAEGLSETEEMAQQELIVVESQELLELRVEEEQL